MVVASSHQGLGIWAKCHVLLFYWLWCTQPTCAFYGFNIKVPKLVSRYGTKAWCGEQSTSLGGVVRNFELDVWRSGGRQLCHSNLTFNFRSNTNVFSLSSSGWHKVPTYGWCSFMKQGFLLHTFQSPLIQTVGPNERLVLYKMLDWS